ncbi:MAG: hypothetical protein WD077_14325 [Bacteroidia bacterium]
MKVHLTAIFLRKCKLHFSSRSRANKAGKIHILTFTCDEKGLRALTLIHGNPCWQSLNGLLATGFSIGLNIFFSSRLYRQHKLKRQRLAQAKILKQVSIIYL